MSGGLPTAAHYGERGPDVLTPTTPTRAPRCKGMAWRRITGVYGEMRQCYRRTRHPDGLCWQHGADIRIEPGDWTKLR